MKKLGLVIVAVFGLFYMAGRGDSGSAPSGTAAQPTETVRVSAHQLFDWYHSNEVQTDLHLKGKMVEVSGRIDSIKLDFVDNMVVRLETRNQFMSAMFTVADSQKQQVAALRKGQTATLRCKRMSMVVGSPSGRDCVLLSVQ